MDMRVPPLSIKTLLESDPLKSRIFVQRLAVALRGSEPRRGEARRGEARRGEVMR